MAQHPDIPSNVTEAVLAASPMIERFYCAGGGAPADLRTDLSHGLAAVVLPTVATPTYTGPERRRVLDLTSA